MKLLILEAENFPLSNLQKEIGKKYEIHTLPSLDNLANNVQAIQPTVIWCRLKAHLSRSLLEGVPGLKTIITSTTGTNHIDLEYCENNQIKVISLHGETAFLSSITSTAELTWGLILSLVRSIPRAVLDVRSGIYNRNLYPGIELQGKTLGILGLGRLGRQVAQYGHAFGMKVIYHDLGPSLAAEKTELVSLETLFSKSDILSLHINGSAENINFVSDQLISLMHPQSYLINTARGEVIDERAVVSALSKDKLKGYATDTISEEHKYLESNNALQSPILKAQAEGLNIIVTPHIGGYSPCSLLKVEEFLIEKLKGIL